MMPLYISVAPDEQRPKVDIILPFHSGSVKAGLAAIEQRPGRFYWLQVSIPMWHRNVEPDPPYTESIGELEVLTWVPVDSVAHLRDADLDEAADFIREIHARFPDVPFLSPGDGRPEGAPRFPMPWELS